jgi:cell wall-associated NlpC family hydrolase
MAVASPPPPRSRSRTPPALKPARRTIGLYLLAGLLVMMLGVAIISALGGNGGCGTGAAPTETAQTTIPAARMALYISAEHKYGVPWSLLAAIESIESGFGQNMGPSDAGARGPMQFMPATWASYGVDANGDRRKDIMDPEDAIPAAARYLNANGAPQDLHQALFAYNHAPWYVQKVLSLASTFADGGNLLVGSACADESMGDGSAQAVYAAANALHAMHVPYNYGGGHITPARPGPGSDGPFDGLDCSSSIAWVLQHAGIDAPTLTSGGYMTWGDPGPGQSVTLYTNPTHIIISIRVNGHPRFFGTSGFGHPEAGTGPAWFTRPVSPGYLAGFVQRHPPGL